MNENQGDDEENTLHDSDDQKAMVLTRNWLDDETICLKYLMASTGHNLLFKIAKYGH